jgi:hypothetical protein
MGLRFGVEHGRGSRDYGEFDVSQMDLVLRGGAILFRREFSPKATLEVAGTGGVGAGVNNDTDIEDWQAKGVVGPEAGVRVEVSPGMAFRPFLGLGWGGIWGFDNSSGASIGTSGFQTANVDGFHFGTAWRIGVDVLPSSMPLAITLGVRRQSYRVPVQEYRNFSFSSREVVTSEGGFFIGVAFESQR